MEYCGFCNYKNNIEDTILFENAFCVCLMRNEPILVGSCVIIPKAHKETVFDLSFEEWEATKQIIDETKKFLDSKYKPDGYNVGWNVGTVGGQEAIPFFHAHLHIIPRYADEPYAGCGIRSWIKQNENMRPDNKESKK